MAAEQTVLVIKNSGNNICYYLYKHGLCFASATTDDGFDYAVLYKDNESTITADQDNIANTISNVYTQWQKLSGKDINVDVVAIKSAVPGGYFLDDHDIDNDFLTRLNNVSRVAPISCEIFNEIFTAASSVFKESRFIAVSDSGFHKTKPDYTWNYPIMLDLADNNDIKKFGYHGLALESVVKQLNESVYKSFQKIIICNLDAITSVTATLNGKSIDSTFGYSELDGIIAPQQSGGIDLAAGLALSKSLNIDPQDLLRRINANGGLRGISGLNNDVAELLVAESKGNHNAGLAMSMYVYGIRQAIAKMSASLEGAEALIFTGKVGVDYPIIRQRVVSGLGYLQFALNNQLNNKCLNPDTVKPIHPRTRTHPILVVPSLEQFALNSHATKLIK